VSVATFFGKNFVAVREQLKELTKQYDKSENDLKALQSVGQVPHVPHGYL